MAFCTKRGLAAHLGLPPSNPSLTFDRDTDVQSFELIFLIPNRPNEKTSRKQKKAGLSVTDGTMISSKMTLSYIL